MTLLTALGIASMAFVAAFTWRAATREPGAGQSPRESITEAWMNIAIGFGVNFAVNLAILPLVGAHVTASENWWMGWIYTTVSIVRQFVIRRWFNDRLRRCIARWGRNHDQRNPRG